MTEKNFDAIIIWGISKISEAKMNECIINEMKHTVPYGRVAEIKCNDTHIEVRNLLGETFLFPFQVKDGALTLGDTYRLEPAGILRYDTSSETAKNARESALAILSYMTYSEKRSVLKSIISHYGVSEIKPREG
ncbi:MAG: hypothetical protein ACP5K5_03240 [Candidatus Micrarchaeia archaeon]